MSQPGHLLRKKEVPSGSKPWRSYALIAASSSQRINPRRRNLRRVDDGHRTICSVSSRGGLAGDCITIEGDVGNHKNPRGQAAAMSCRLVPSQTRSGYAAHACQIGRAAPCNCALISATGFPLAIFRSRHAWATRKKNARFPGKSVQQRASSRWVMQR